MTDTGRYGASRKASGGTEVVLAEIQAELRNQGKQITTMTKKVESVGETVTKMNTQMEHLVTKEACAEGRRQLSDDLKGRMDGDREITGTNLRIPDLLAEVSSRTPPPTPHSPQPSVDPEPSKQHRGFLFWLGVVAACITVASGVLGVSYAAIKVQMVLETAETYMETQQQIEQQQPENTRHIQPGSTLNP